MQSIAKERSPAPLGAGQVLVVDDEPHVREVATLMLEHLGYEVLLAADGDEAVRLFRTQRADVAWVLLDLTMPGMTGGEVFHSLRALRPDVPIVLSSGHDESSATQVLGDCGDYAYLQKPYTLQSLTSTLCDTGV